MRERFEAERAGVERFRAGVKSKFRLNQLIKLFALKHPVIKTIHVSKGCKAGGCIKAADASTLQLTFGGPGPALNRPSARAVDRHGPGFMMVQPGRQFGGV